jgi:hypothetical protein
MVSSLIQSSTRSACRSSKLIILDIPEIRDLFAWAEIEAVETTYTVGEHNIDKADCNVSTYYQSINNMAFQRDAAALLAGKEIQDRYCSV